MGTQQLLKDKPTIIMEIKERIVELDDFIASKDGSEQVLKQYESWRVIVSRILDKGFTKKSLGMTFLADSKIVLNKLSVSENAQTLKEGLERTRAFLVGLNERINAGEFD